jgi:hypothetical protein
MKKVIYYGPEKEIRYNLETYEELKRLGAEDVCDGNDGRDGVHHFNGTTLFEELLDGGLVRISLFGDEKSIGEVEKLVLSVIKKR